MTSVNQRLVRLATWASVLVALMLVFSKAIAWQLTHALSLQASLVDSFLDAMASLVNFFAVRHALRPADDDHRFGHGKAEALAGLGQSGFIAASAVWLIVEGSQRVIEPIVVHNSTVSIVVMVASIVATLFLVVFQTYVVRKTKSLAISADSLHYRADLLSNIAVLASLKMSQLYGWGSLDIVVGVGIALYLLKSSWSIGWDAVNVLMDKELSDEARDEILKITLKHPDVRGVHDLRTRSSGFRSFIQMHLDISEALSFRRAHDVAKEISDHLSEHFPQAEVLIHIDPIP